jgi:hypothetical protein
LVLKNGSQAADKTSRLFAPRKVDPSAYGGTQYQHERTGETSWNYSAWATRCLFQANKPYRYHFEEAIKGVGKHSLELYTLAYEGRLEDLQDEASDNYLDSLIREVFETARELGLVPPKSRPPKLNIKRALKELGFGSDEQGI